MAAKSISSFRTPLDAFLADVFVKYDSALYYPAKELTALPFDAASFRRDLVAKLKRLKYPQPERPGNDKTFEEKLAAAGVLDALLHPETLRALWKCILIRTIAERDRELAAEGKDVTGEPLKSQYRAADQMKDDLKALERIQNTYAPEESIEKIYSIVERKYRDMIKKAILSEHRRSRTELLTGRPRTGLLNVIKSEQLASNIAIYRVLERALRPASPKNRSGIFLCQLAELISAEPNVRALGDGLTLSKALERSH
jgi:hypothetical protein